MSYPRISGLVNDVRTGTCTPRLKTIIKSIKVRSASREEIGEKQESKGREQTKVQDYRAGGIPEL